MSKSTFSNPHATFSIQFRAICEDDSFKGPWHDNINDAKVDASNHRRMPGNNDHVIDIITNQTLSMTYLE